MNVLQGDRPVGAVTSGCLSPTLGKPIAMAYVKKETCEVGQILQVDLGSRRVDAQVMEMPFYKRDTD